MSLRVTLFFTTMLWDDTKNEKNYIYTKKKYHNGYGWGCMQKMDRNNDGVVTIDEFLDCCRCDQAITNSMLVFDSSI